MTLNRCFPALFLVLALLGCEDSSSTADVASGVSASPAPAPPGTAPEGVAAPPAVAPVTQPAPAGNEVVAVEAPSAFAGMIPRSGVSGVVKESMGGGGYTYLLLETKHGTFWCAGPEVAVKKGDRVKVSEGLLMENFSSKTLKKTFKNIYFVRSIEGVVDASGSAPASAPGSSPSSAPVSAPASGAASASAVPAPKRGEFALPPGGISVEALWLDRKKWSGKVVKLRGRAVKVTSGLVGGLHWIHLQDGSGGPGTNDIIVTTSSPVTVGDTIAVEGTLVLNKELGPSMKFEALVHNAKVTVE